MISILIATIDDPYLVRTIEQIRGAADGPSEFIVVNDGGKPIDLKDTIVINHADMLGRRVSFNEAARLATGDYLLIIDPHCSMTNHWDTWMMESCKESNLVFPVIRDMDPQTWQHRPGDYMHVSMNREYTEKWWFRKKLKDCQLEEESMCFTGCGWMIAKKRYWQLGGYDESLGKYGWDGPEWSCKIWMNGDPGRVILRTDVICGHIFGTNEKGKLYRCEMIPKQKYVAYMQNKWADKIPSLCERFAPVPDWSESASERNTRMSQGTEREVKLERQKESITRNDKGEIIRKVIVYYEYVFKDDGNGPNEEEIRAQHLNDLVEVRRETWELKDGQLQKVA